MGGTTLTYMLVTKTKEMVIDFQRKIGRPERAQVVLGGGEGHCRTVETYKYLGVLFDSALSWKQNTNAVMWSHVYPVYLVYIIIPFQITIMVTSSGAWRPNSL